MSFYADWVDAHRVAFGITDGPRIHAMFAWEEAVTRGLGATAGELADCTRRMLAADDTPSFADEHLSALKRHLAALRAERRLAADRVAGGYAERVGVCADCSDSGWVVVPDLRHVKDDAWVPARMTAAGTPYRVRYAVACRCRKGDQTAAQAHDAKRPCLTLARYEAANPWWRDQLADEAAGLAALHRAEARAPAATDAAKVVAAVADSTRMGGR